MPEFNVRSDSVNVEQIMEQIRARIREKRGVDYTEQQIRELAAVKLEKFLDPRGVRSDLLSEFRRSGPDPNYAFEDDTLFRSTRGLIQSIRRLLQPVLKLFFNPNPLIHVLHMQSQINDLNASRHQLYYELIHNLVVETTRLGIEVKNLKMRVESLDARVDFSERRARALEGAVMYRPHEDEEGRQGRPMPSERTGPGVVAPAVSSAASPGATSSPAAGTTPVAEGAGQRSRRRRRRRSRRGGAPAASVMGVPAGAAQGQSSGASEPPPGDQPAGTDAADAPNSEAGPSPSEGSTDRGSDLEQ
jgi:hypothetical protein